MVVPIRANIVNGVSDDTFDQSFAVVISTISYSNWCLMLL